MTDNEIKPVVTFDERPILCPQCGYCHPFVIMRAREKPMSFDILVECEKCGYRSETGETIKDLTEKWTNDV